MRGKMENNIFKFVTREISHDAFICWLVNWINIYQTSENKDIKELAQKFIEKIVEKNKNLKVQEMVNCKDYEVEIEKQYTMYYQDKSGKKQRRAIDVLLTIQDRHTQEKFKIIIEDKLRTKEHDNQMETYRNMLLEKEKKTERESIEILTCYYKIFNECDLDKKVANSILDRDTIMQLIDDNIKNKEKYQYLSDYYDYLKRIQYYSKMENIKMLETSLREEENKDLNEDELLKFDNIREIIYFAFFNSLKLQKSAFEWDVDTTPNGDTYWCNIYGGLRLGENELFMKINFYKKDTKPTLKIRIKEKSIPKRKEKKEKDTPVLKEMRAKRREELRETISENYLKRFSKEIKNIKAANDEAEGEMTLFKYEKIGELTFEELKEIIQELNSVLTANK